MAETSDAKGGRSMSGIMISLLLALVVFGYSLFRAEKSQGI